MGIPVGMPSEAMMTMATLMVDHTISWCPSLPPTPSGPSLCPHVLTTSKFDACGNKQQSSCNLSILHKIPTRNYQQDLPAAVINHLDNSNDDRTTTKTMMLLPTTLEGNASPLPYQLELAAITAAINWIWQHDAENAVPLPCLTHPTPETPSMLTASSAVTAKMDTNMPTVLPPPAALRTLHATAIMPNFAIVDANDNNSNHPHDAQC